MVRGQREYWKKQGFWGPIFVCSFFFCFFFCFFFVFALLGLHLQHMEVPRLEVKLELQPPASIIATATATWDLSHVCDLYHS